MSNNNKRKSITLKKKIEIIREMESGTSQSMISKREKIPNSTLSTWLKNKDKIETAFLVMPENYRKIRSTNYEELDKLLLDWVKNIRSKNIPINGQCIKEKANSIAQNLEIKDFVCSTGWLDRFKTRHSLNYCKISGEGKLVNLNTIEEWKKEKWENLKSRYSPENIFNADETALFYKCLPNKTLKFKNESCNEGRFSKERVTVLLCASMVGEKRKPLIIGKFAHPRCFKGKNITNFNYHHNKKAWMTSEIFTNYLLKWDSDLRKKNRKILLLVDNATSHPQISNKLTNIEISFLPANTTSVLQPMDQGIIHAFKCHYKKTLISNYIQLIDECKEPSVNMFDALCWIDSAWCKVSADTIKNCYGHAGLIDTNVIASESVLNPNVVETRLMEIGVFETKDEVIEYINLDNNIEISSDADNLANFSEKMDINMIICDEQKIEDTYKEATLDEAYSSFKILINALYQKDFYDSKNIKSMMLELEEKLEDEVLKSKKVQTQLTDFGFESINKYNN